ncbi:hypothetical protein [Bacteriovorax sp. Seq25_V]|uniref:hypothetical protein n=1 Tax=Bacteriovorax sp. Seq25_V TaxID=1201288 RepID=UPI000389E19A|nr:hypothetical protein [Bacteriovorax sp. Seq25_V]EQC47701.1 hypothetical protein M900_A0232 [Bacteriovorax sp. Seq25_V]
MAIKISDGLELSNRMPASEEKVYKNSCTQGIKSFFSRNDFSITKYEDYYAKINVSNEVLEFDSIEHYVAYIDKKVESSNISLAEFLLTRVKSKKLTQFFINSSRPDKFYSFLFDGIFEELILSSIKIKYIPKSKEFALKKLIIEKMADEALVKLNSNSSSTWARFANSKFVSNSLELVSYLPLAFGMPPLKIPHFLLGNEKELLKAKNLDELEKMFLELSQEDRDLLTVKKGYDVFRRYYAVMIAGYYSYVTAVEVVEVNKNEDLLVSMNESVDEAITDLKEMSSPSCKSIYRCLDEYRLDWDGQGEDVYLEYKNVCKDVYSVSEDC